MGRDSPVVWSAWSEFALAQAVCLEDRRRATTLLLSGAAAGELRLTRLTREVDALANRMGES